MTLVTAIGAAVARPLPGYRRVRRGLRRFRRQPAGATPTGVKIGVNPNGPVDHSVPVLKVTGRRWQAPRRPVRLRLPQHDAHAPRSTSSRGDYAGFAAADLEARHPGATALFLSSAAPTRIRIRAARSSWRSKHGDALAAEVERVIAAPMTPRRGPDPHRLPADSAAARAANARRTSKRS